MGLLRLFWHLNRSYFWNCQFYLPHTSNSMIKPKKKNDEKLQIEKKSTSNTFFKRIPRTIRFQQKTHCFHFPINISKPKMHFPAIFPYLFIFNEKLCIENKLKIDWNELKLVGKMCSNWSNKRSGWIVHLLIVLSIYCWAIKFNHSQKQKKSIEFYINFFYWKLSICFIFNKHKSQHEYQLSD